MPSRNRTTSEGGHHFTAGILPHSTRIPYHGSRPHSMHSRGLSHSPPAASGHCSTDSVGSLVSIDDGEFDLAVSATSPRYGHSSTPDEPAIIEENCSDYCHWTQENGMQLLFIFLRFVKFALNLLPLFFYSRIKLFAN